jgi:hypothetical protein
MGKKMKQQTLNFSDGQHIVRYHPSVVGFAVQGLQRAKEYDAHVSKCDLRVKGKGGKIRLTSKPKGEVC